MTIPISSSPASAAARTSADSPCPFVGDVLNKGKKINFIAAQSQVAPNLQGKYEYDFADYAEMTPLLKMYTLGHQTDMKPIKGDGLRYHGCSPIISLLRNKGYHRDHRLPGRRKTRLRDRQDIHGERGLAARSRIGVFRLLRH